MTCSMSGPPDQNNPWISELKDVDLSFPFLLPSCGPGVLGLFKEQQEIVNWIETKEKIRKRGMSIQFPWGLCV